MNNTVKFPATQNARLRILLGKAAETAGALAGIVKNPEHRARLQQKAEKIRRRVAELED